jgi:hypothetical protein
VCAHKIIVRHVNNRIQTCNSASSRFLSSSSRSQTPSVTWAFFSWLDFSSATVASFVIASCTISATRSQTSLRSNSFSSLSPSLLSSTSGSAPTKLRQKSWCPEDYKQKYKNMGYIQKASCLSSRYFFNQKMNLVQKSSTRPWQKHWISLIAVLVSIPFWSFSRSSSNFQ